eukprot:829753-Prorocentrum_minimum.AAC.1
MDQSDAPVTSGRRDERTPPSLHHRLYELRCIREGGGVNSLSEGVNSRSEGVNSRSEGVNSRSKGVVRSSEDAESGPQHRPQTANRAVRYVKGAHGLPPRRVDQRV